MMLISCTVIYHEMHKHGREGSSKQTIKCAREKKAITAEFLLSYILPLFAFDFTLWNQVVLFLVFFVTLGYLCVSERVAEHMWGNMLFHTGQFGIAVYHKTDGLVR